MSQTVFDVATVELMGYDELLKYAADSLNYAGPITLQNHISSVCRGHAYDPVSSLTTQEQWAQQLINELRDNGFEVQYNGNDVWTGTVFPQNIQIGATNPVNSNMVNVSRGRVRSWYGGLTEVGSGGMKTWTPQRMPVSGGLGSKAMYFLGSIGSGVAAASTGIWLGKTFDSALYRAFPNFWDSIGWSGLNPDTWGSLTEGSDSPFAGLLNFMLGIDGTNGNAQAYMSEDMLAYLAYGLYNAGIFSSSGSGYVVDDMPANIFKAYNNGAYQIPIAAVESNQVEVTNVRYQQSTVYRCEATGSGNFRVVAVRYLTGNTVQIYLCSDANFTLRRVLPSTQNMSVFNTTFNGKTIYYGATMVIGGYPTQLDNPNDYYTFSYDVNMYDSSVSSGLDSPKEMEYISLFGEYVDIQPIEGIGTQDGATLPDTTGWDDLANVLPSLQQQYPDAFSNPMIWNTDTPYDETTGNQTRYIPVPFPFANSATDTQPLSGTQTQTNTSLNTTPQEILDLITKTIQQTDTQPATPPTNPTDTGTGSTPTPTAPTGNASALWSVYHPTQAQVDSFGAWLWGSPFLTNIGKLFQNPIDGVISLHKIFATPVDSGTGTIVVGTLDSEVPSATVNQQYVYVDCGSVNCYEIFGNVFDYSPHTQVSLYLPFIGIVPLDVNDIMRSSINVTYGVDVYTGACLAMVSVSRDGNTVNMYQYAGVASVEYPLSNVQNGQLVSGLLAIGAGVASIVATGGVSTPAVGAIVGGVAASSNSSVGKSGGFSGNSGAMGGKIPYLILKRPQTKVADTFVYLNGYPTNVSGKLGDFSGQVTVKHVHVEGISATDKELIEIESLLKSGILI